MFREVAGEELRRARQQQNKTLRSVAIAGAISVGYLSEVERGIKEPSSEIIQAICRALEIQLSDFLLRLSFEMAKREQQEHSLSSKKLIPVSA